MFQSFQHWVRRRRYREGKTISRFVARDVRRDILIVSAARIDEGIITGRVRTTNVLYLSRGLVPEPEFEAPQELHIEKMWDWTGQSWGGLPDGTSIVDHLRNSSDPSSRRIAPDENVVSHPDRTFIGGRANPYKYGMPLRFTSGDHPDQETILRAAVRLKREPFYVDNDGFECEIIAAAVHADGLRLVYVESRAKPCGKFVDITIKINYVNAFGGTSHVDIESYNPFFGCDVGFLRWINDDIALLIYTEKHWTFAYRIGDKWPPNFVKIEELWQIKDDVLSYRKYKADVVKRLRIPSLEPMHDISVSDAERDGTLPAEPKPVIRH